jgi:hypothetical protein
MARKKSKLRGLGGPGTGFFAFQDIIMTVIAFVLLNILFQITITRGIIDHALPLSGKDDTRNRITELKRELTALQATYAALAAKIDQPIPQTGGTSDGAIAATLETNRAALAEKVEILERKLTELAAALGADAAAMVSDAIRNEISTVTSELAVAQAEQKELEARRVPLRADILQLQERVAEALKRLRTIWVIAEPTNTSKTPLFGIVGASKVEWFRAGDATSRGATRSSEWQSGRLAVAGHSPTDYYTVLYFRPSAASHFDDLIKALRAGRYEVGYDVLAEEQEISFTLR